LLLLGDNAYDSGTDAEFQTRFFDIYSSNILKNHVLFPSPGNHDYANNATRQADHNIPYYSMFTTQQQANAVVWHQAQKLISPGTGVMFIFFLSILTAKKIQVQQDYTIHRERRSPG
jgi:hypothetical protein